MSTIKKRGKDVVSILDNSFPLVFQKTVLNYSKRVVPGYFYQNMDNSIFKNWTESCKIVEQQSNPFLG